jgi:hypothetical protein
MSMISIRSLIKDMQVYRVLAGGGLGEQTMQAVALEHPDHVRHAQRLHADVYLRRGFVQPGDIDEDGRLTLLADPHQEHAEYFVVLGSDDPSDVRAVSRQIRMSAHKGFASFPMLDLAQIDKRHLAMIQQHDPSSCVEISALAKQSGESPMLPLVLYRAMLHRSFEIDDKIWLMACDVRLFQRLKVLFGPAIVQVGKVTPYYGGDVVPAMLKLDEALAGLIAGARDQVPLRRSIRKALPRFFMNGFPIDRIKPQQRIELIKLGIISK